MNEEVELVLVEDNINDSEFTIHALRKSNLSNKLIHLKDGAEVLSFIFCKVYHQDRKLTSYSEVILLSREFNSNQKTINIPIVILKSSNEDSDIKECYTLGVNSYVVKPVQFEFKKNIVNEIGLYWMIVNQPPIYDL